MLYHRNHHACNAPEYSLTPKKVRTHSLIVHFVLGNFRKFVCWSVAKTHSSPSSRNNANNRTEDLKFSTFRMRMTRFLLTAVFFSLHFVRFFLMKMEFVHDFRDYLIKFGCVCVRAFGRPNWSQRERRKFIEIQCVNRKKCVLFVRVSRWSFYVHLVCCRREEKKTTITIRHNRMRSKNDFLTLEYNFIVAGACSLLLFGCSVGKVYSIRSI